MRIDRSVVDWLCDRAGIEGVRARAVLHLRWCEEYTYRAIAAELSISESTVRQVVYQARQRFLRHEWDLEDLDWAEDRADGRSRESWQEHAETVYAALKGPAPSSPATPVYDELGRPVARRAPVFTIDDVYQAMAVVAGRLRKRFSGRGVDKR